MIALKETTHVTIRENDEKTPKDRRLPELYDATEKCCGCSACYAICPVEAITMEPDVEGFLYPSVNAEKCIRCYSCIGVCRFKKDQRCKKTEYTKMEFLSNRGIIGRTAKRQGTSILIVGSWIKHLLIGMLSIVKKRGMRHEKTI